MYTPPYFKSDNPELTRSIIEQYPFGTMITPSPDGLKVTHIPFLFNSGEGEHGTLLGHVAKKNEHWQHLEGDEETLAIFQGPHAYVSPTWYEEHFSVPTWNYASVHLYGNPRLMDEERSYELLMRMLEVFEGPNSTYDFNAGEDYIRKQLPAIVAFEMPVSRIEAKFKMSQNKSEIDRASVIRHLGERDDELSRETAACMLDIYAREGTP